jgi:chemotaxis protein methyltransferase CheR
MSNEVAQANTAVQEPPKQALAPANPALFRLRDLIYKVCGIYQPDNKFYFLEDRCMRRVKALRLGSIREYLDVLTTSADRDSEMRNLLNEITVGETCFFRSTAQIEALRKIILPKLVESKQRLSFTRLKFWSAGCSTGEEPYTLAMIVLEEMAGLLKGWTCEILATDLNERSVEKAKQGVYDQYALRNTSPYFRNRYFVENGSTAAIRDEVKKLVSFNRLNLSDESKILFMRGMDLVCCANVLIYFDGASKRRTVHHFFNSLLPGGYFFLGHSESLYGINDEFQLVHFPGASAYYKAPPAMPAGGPA